VTTKAILVYLFRRSLGRVENLGYVATAFNVPLACAVTVLTGDPVLAVFKGQLGVRIVGEPFTTSSWQVAQVSVPT